MAYNFRVEMSCGNQSFTFSLEETEAYYAVEAIERGGWFTIPATASADKSALAVRRVNGRYVSSYFRAFVSGDDSGE